FIELAELQDERVALRFQVADLGVARVVLLARLHRVQEDDADDDAGQEHRAGAEPVGHGFSTSSRTFARYGSSLAVGCWPLAGAAVGCPSFFALLTTTTSPMATARSGRIHTAAATPLNFGLSRT